MRKIEIVPWTAKDEEGKDKNESILEVLDALLSMKSPDEFPRGLANFRLMERLSKAFVKADSTKILELEETDYAFLKLSIEKDVPSMWAKNPNIVNAINNFLDIKED